MRARSGSFLQVQSSDELVGPVFVRSDGNRVCPLRDLPRKPQPVEALLMGVNRELGKPVGAYIEVELEVIIFGSVCFPTSGEKKLLTYLSTPSQKEMYTVLKRVKPRAIGKL